MADEDFDHEVVHSLAENIRKAIDPSEGGADFYRPSPELLLNPRQLELNRDLRIFRSAVRFLRRIGHMTMPGIYFETGSLPSSPENPRLVLANDSVSAALREAWTAHREQKPQARRDHADEGSVIEMELGESTRVFSNGLASAFLAAAASGASGLIHFTVNSQNDKYRVHLTEQYWYSPVVFGSSVSTPVDDMVYPANYRFGGDNGGPIVWDSGIHTASTSHTSTTVTKF